MHEKLRLREIGISGSTEAYRTDVAIGLTEGWIAGVARGEPERIVGSYVQSPLRIWLYMHP